MFFIPMCLQELLFKVLLSLYGKCVNSRKLLTFRVHLSSLISKLLKIIALYNKEGSRIC